MGEEIIRHAAAFGPEYLMAFVIMIGFGLLAKQLLDEYRRQNERKADLEERNSVRASEIELAREQRKREELAERAKRDRERSEMEGRIVSQMDRSNTVLEGVKTLMESVLVSNQALHEDFVTSRERSQGMAADVTHIRDRVDLIYEKEN